MKAEVPTLKTVDVETRLRDVLGVSAGRALAAGLDLHTVEDLLGHYPRRYEQRGELTDLDSLVVGENVTVQARVERIRRRPTRRGHMHVVTVTDGAHRLDLTFFNLKWLESQLRPGVEAMFAGRVSLYRNVRQLEHPQFELIPDDPAETDSFAGAVIPIYPSTKDVASWRLRKYVHTVLERLVQVADPLPGEVRAAHHLLDLRSAWEAVHRPRELGDPWPGRLRLKWNEAFLLQVTLAGRRHAARSQPAVPRRPLPGGLLDEFDKRLPFQLTAGQVEVSAAILAELAAEHPMYRLLQGEVGSGKTVVALRAMLVVADSGGQAALLAPTEVLAQQHFRSIRDLLGPLAAAGQLGAAERATRVALLTGSQSGSERRAALDEAADGTAGIVVGTHALLQEMVKFADLGLVVIDEQHRFGVQQRDALRAKGATPPHVLVMTATPIPRTVAITVYGDLETSVLRELPVGRAGIETAIVPRVEKPAWWQRTWRRVREEVAAGHQAYVLCPRIGGDAGDDDAQSGEEDSAGRPAMSVLDMRPELIAGPLHGLRVAELHGRLPPDAKDDVMRRFAAGQIDVLVATTVIEVGVDVPNATAMVILDADRFGVSQLHQLRGRVGRGTAPGVCLLVTDAPTGTPARQRLEAVEKTLDGFELARLDLEQRREGDVLGEAQSGRRKSLRLLSLLQDETLILAAREEATRLVEADPDLQAHPVLAAALARALDETRAEFLEKA